jgi:hypothetical protein
MTSSVMPDMCGSMNTAIMIVAPPLMMDDRVLEVTRTDGSSTPAYREANTPTVHSAVAPTLSSVMRPDTPCPERISVTLRATGTLATSRM